MGVFLRFVRGIRFSGRMVLIFFVVFFGIIFCVNGYFFVVAFRSFPGVVVEVDRGYARDLPRVVPEDNN